MYYLRSPTCIFVCLYVCVFSDTVMTKDFPSEKQVIVFDDLTRVKTMFTIRLYLETSFGDFQFFS